MIDLLRAARGRRDLLFGPISLITLAHEFGKKVTTTLRHRTLTLSLILLTSLSAATGCLQPQGSDSPRLTETSTQKRGIVIMLPGIEGNGWQFAGTIHGLKDAGLKDDIEIIPWGTNFFGPLDNLTNLVANKKRAQGIAERIIQIKKESPDRHITIIGLSGGGGLAMLTLEVLPKDMQVDKVIVLCAAVSNNYDLARALPHCREKLINYYSPLDGIVGWGTSIFGTIDRKRCISAGHSGFLDVHGKPCCDEKLSQICWVPAWKQFGHYGGHIDYLSEAWAREVLAAQIDPTLDRSKLSKL